MILVCGEALVDLFLQTPEGVDIPARAVPGGSPFNVAVGLARLGAPVAFLGGLSTDVFGRQLAGMLAREGVDLRYAVNSERLTTISVVATDATGSPAYAFHGEGKADRMVAADALPPDLPDTVEAIALGSYTIAVDPVGAALLELARRERGRRLISLDPNLRPTVTPDIAAWRRRLAAFLACATIVKASDEDIAAAYGADADIAAIAGAWLAEGPSLVVVTRGAAGATAFTAGHRVSVAGRPVAVVDTVGAGDAVHAALLAEFHRRRMLTPAEIAGIDPAALREIMEFCVRAAAITCTRRGADLPQRRDIPPD